MLGREERFPRQHHRVSLRVRRICQYSPRRLHLTDQDQGVHERGPGRGVVGVLLQQLAGQPHAVERATVADEIERSGGGPELHGTELGAVFERGPQGEGLRPRSP